MNQAKANKVKNEIAAELDATKMESAALREEVRVLNEDVEAYRAAVAELKGDLEDEREDRASEIAAFREARRRNDILVAELEAMTHAHSAKEQ